MMKANAALALFLLAAPALFAQEADPKPDYSRPTLLRIAVEKDRKERRAIRIEENTITFNALGTRWRFMPAMLPLAGTRPTTTKEWPDAFALTGTPYATTPRTFYARREINRELSRIDKVTKKKAKIKVTTQ
jgi:hypothetical protein